jgi:hypothetical protein
MHPSRDDQEACETQRARLISYTSWLLLVALSVTAYGAGCSRKGKSEPKSTVDTTKIEVTPPFSAEMWLRLDRSSRMAFIVAYLLGRWDGVSAGCSDAKLEVGSLPGVSGFTPDVADEMWINCGKKYKPSNRPFESYESVITDFYNRYPEDRSVEVPDLLQLLAPDPELTSDEMHKRIKITQKSINN